jgi:hypothetical protein
MELAISGSMSPRMAIAPMERRANADDALGGAAVGSSSFLSVK